MADIETDDGLNGVPWWDATALRMVQAIERSIVRLRLECQGEFAIINAIEMQLESRDTESDVVRLLADSMAALAAARPISERDRRTLEERSQISNESQPPAARAERIVGGCRDGHRGTAADRDPLQLPRGAVPIPYCLPVG